MRYVIFDQAGMPVTACLDLAAEELPEGAHEIDAAQMDVWPHLRLVNGEVVDSGPPPVVVATIKTRLLPDLRARRDLAMNVLDGLQSDALASGDTGTALAIKTAKQACRDIPALNTVAATDEASLRALYLAEWQRIAALVPAPVRAAFAAVLA